MNPFIQRDVTRMLWNCVEKHNGQTASMQVKPGQAEGKAEAESQRSQMPPDKATGTVRAGRYFPSPAQDKQGRKAGKEPFTQFKDDVKDVFSQLSSQLIPSPLLNGGTARPGGNAFRVPAFKRFP